MKSTLAAYLLWLFCLVGICGLHRLYCGRFISGIVWLLTFGLLGVGQLIDLLLIPSMVNASNRMPGVHQNVSQSVIVYAGGPPPTPSSN